jgi:tetratricopeptide (TPR) repeat protein
MNAVRTATWFGVLLGCWFVSSASDAATTSERLSNQCIADDSYKALQACPGGPSKFDIKKKRAVAFSSAPPEREKKAAQDKLAPRQASEEMMAGQRDLRTTRLQARARALLVTEISGLERLYKNTRPQSADRPQLIRRLAEGYVELESAANRDKISADIKADEAKNKKQKEAYDKARRESASAEKIVKAARDNAVKYYQKMIDEYPSYSKIDEVLYYLAYEHEQAGNLDEARKVYLQLIEKAPDSKYVPNAYLAFGELFFQEAMADPSQWKLAAQAYQKVTKYPPPDNKVFGYAHYKLAYVYWNSGEYPKAIQEFKEVIDYSYQYENLPGAIQLRKAARRDVIPVYAISGRPDRAFNFFKPLSGDGTGENTQTIEMMTELGLAYLDTGHYAEAIELYQDLMVRDKGDRFCVYQTYVTQATQAMKSGDKQAVRKELERQLAVRNEFNKENHPDKDKFECSNRTAELLSETAMSWHLEAVGSGGTRGTGDRKTMDLASYLYKKVVDNYTQEDFSKFTFPRIIKEDWPNIYKIKYAMADLLFVQERWEDCGPAFDSVVDEDPTSPEAPEAAYASVLCYQKMYDQLHQGAADRKSAGLGPKGAGKEERQASGGEWDKLKPMELTPMQKGMIQAFNRYTCYISPPKGDTQAENQYVEVKYARARTFFEARHWEEAAIGFRDIALNHSDKEAGIYAAQLYLEALNVLGAKSEPPKPTCFDDMASDVPALISLYCTGSKAGDNKDQCDLLTRIQCDVKRLSAENTIKLADTGKGQEALDLYKKGGDAYIDLWKTYGEQQLLAGAQSQCGRMDEILYNAARAYRAAHLLATAIGVRRILLDPRYGMNESELAKKAIYENGANYQAFAVYDQAADEYMRYAEATSYKGEFADQAVSDAVVLNLGLGREDQAIAGAASFNKYFGARKPKQAAQIAFAVASHYAEKKDWDEVRKKLSGGAMNLIDRQATLDVKVQAHALLGLALTRLKSNASDAEYRRVVAAWSDPAKAEAAIMGIEDEDAAAKQRRLGRALTAVGEAYFYFAEKKREKVNAITFPAYSGTGSKEAVQKHINTKVKQWIEKKKPLIDEATAEYKKIVDLKPVPPPSWTIAAGSRVGEMWGTFVKEFRAAPIPDSIRKDPELRTAYYYALDSASEPQKQVAKSAYKTCLDYSVRYQYFDEYSRACEVWLAGNYKSEYHLVDEFSGAPNRLNSALQEKPHPVRLNGEPFVVSTEQAKNDTPAKPAEGASK